LLNTCLSLLTQQAGSTCMLWWNIKYDLCNREKFTSRSVWGVGLAVELSCVVLSCVLVHVNILFWLNKIPQQKECCSYDVIPTPAQRKHIAGLTTSNASLIFKSNSWSTSSLNVLAACRWATVTLSVEARLHASTEDLLLLWWNSNEWNQWWSTENCNPCGL